MAAQQPKPDIGAVAQGFATLPRPCFNDENIWRTRAQSQWSPSQVIASDTSLLVEKCQDGGEIDCTAATLAEVQR